MLGFACGCYHMLFYPFNELMQKTTGLVSACTFQDRINKMLQHNLEKAVQIKRVMKSYKQVNTAMVIHSLIDRNCQVQLSRNKISSEELR